MPKYYVWFVLACVYTAHALANLRNPTNGAEEMSNSVGDDSNLKIPINFLKTGSDLRSELLHQRLAGLKNVDEDGRIEISPSVTTTDDEESSDKELSSEYEDDDENGKSEECPIGEYWHLRGEQCVPERCPLGTKRNWKNGECNSLSPLNRRYHLSDVNGGKPSHRFGYYRFYQSGDRGKGIRRRLEEHRRRIYKG